ncbi:MAG: ATPase [Bacteroidota bacterium]
MKTNIFTFITILSIISVFAFAGDTVKETEFKVSGNCGMCKSRIEKAMKISEVKFSKWDKTSKMLKIAYLSEKISLDSLQQRLASVGHDTEKFTAADSVYTNLPGCCLYRGEDNTH